MKNLWKGIAIAGICIGYGIVCFSPLGQDPKAMGIGAFLSFVACLAICDQ